MGMRSLRAICPNCGGKIHTQPKGLGHFTWANSWMLVQTGSECQHCGVALSGKVAADNKAILAEDAEKTWWERETGTDPTNERRYPLNAEDLFIAAAEVMEANSRSGFQMALGRPFTKLNVDRGHMRLRAASSFRRWEIAVASEQEGSRLWIMSSRIPGAFLEYGERRRLEKRILRCLDQQLDRLSA